MRKQIRLRSLFILMALISILFAISASVSVRTDQFFKRMIQPDENTRQQLVTDAKLPTHSNSSSDTLRIRIEEPTILDYVLFRRNCQVTFTASTTSGRQTSSSKCTNTYRINLTGTHLIDTKNEWLMSVL